VHKDRTHGRAGVRLLVDNADCGPPCGEISLEFSHTYAICGPWVREKMHNILVNAMYPDLGYNRFKEGLGGSSLMMWELCLESPTDVA